MNKRELIVAAANEIDALIVEARRREKYPQVPSAEHEVAPVLQRLVESVSHEAMVRRFHDKMGLDVDRPMDKLGYRLAYDIKRMADSVTALHESYARKEREVFNQDGDRVVTKAPLALLRMRLVLEEVGELAEALSEADPEAVADALADLEYVTVGTAVAYGIPHDRVFHEVHRSNMTKTPLDENRKGGKGAGYEPPDLGPILSFDPTK